MTKLVITILVSVCAFSAQANEFFATCEHVTDMAVLAKDNVPYWTANRNSNVQSCYADVKEFIAVATADEIAQFNAEYAGQIVIFATDADFAQHVSSKKSHEQAFVIPMSVDNNITPVIKPSHAPMVLFQ